jgi:hypothetical protein
MCMYVSVCLYVYNEVGHTFGRYYYLNTLVLRSASEYIKLCTSANEHVALSLSLSHLAHIAFVHCQWAEPLPASVNTV